MTLPVPQRRRYRPMPADAFNQYVLLRPASYATLTAQGGANPDTNNHSGGYGYMASVQPMVQPTSQKSGDVRQGGSLGSIPQACTYYDVLIAYAEDVIIQSLRIGDEIEWGDMLFQVLAPANDSGGLGTIWRIKCELVAS